MFAFKFSNDRYRSSLDYVCFNKITFPTNFGNCPRVPWSLLQSFCEIYSLLVFDIQNLGHCHCHCDVQQVIQNMLELCFYTAFMFKSRPTKNYYFCRWCLAISTYFVTCSYIGSLATWCNGKLFLHWTRDRTRYLLRSLPTQLYVWFHIKWCRGSANSWCHYCPSEGKTVGEFMPAPLSLEEWTRTHGLALQQFFWHQFCSPLVSHHPLNAGTQLSPMPQRHMPQNPALPILPIIPIS